MNVTLYNFLHIAKLFNLIWIYLPYGSLSITVMVVLYSRTFISVCIVL